MTELLIGIVIGLFCLFGFVLGLKCGQRVQKGVEVQMPSIKNPVNALREYEEKKEQRKEQEKLKVMLENIDNYTGDGIGQKDIPE